MPTCCQCKGVGRCRSCSCKKIGLPSVDCLPFRRGRCDDVNQLTSDNIGLPIAGLLARPYILSLVREDIQRAVGPLQLCVEHEGGCEAAVHTMGMMFKDKKSEAVLLDRCKQCFQQPQQRHHPTQCHEHLSLTSYNSHQYLQATSKTVQNQKLVSREGTTQGNHLAMAIYAISLQTLVQLLNDQNAKQV